MSERYLHMPDGERLALDAKGYLTDRSQWSPAVADVMAERDGVTLEPDHWEVLRIFQEYFDQFEIEPPMRALISRVRERLGDEKASSRYLYRLFPDGPTTQACRYAGLPRPVSCI